MFVPYAESLIERLVYVARNPSRLDRLLDEQLAFAQSNTLEIPNKEISLSAEAIVLDAGLRERI